jgi:PPOX class probable FMN-dependent enzyme
MRGVFSPEQRDLVRDHVLEIASADRRVIAGAVVGSFAQGHDDRWSDLDLTFAIPDDAPVDDVLADWTRELADTFDAVHLFDLPFQRTIYRVFLLPGCLQVDLSFTPASEFRSGPGFTLLFGSAVDPAGTPRLPTPSAQHVFGLAVHHAIRARICIERGRYWQAAYWIDQLREHALSLACSRRGLNSSHGRGFDDLPGDVLAAFSDALVRSVDRDDLLRALGSAVDGLLGEAEDIRDVAVRVEDQLRALAPAPHVSDTLRTMAAPRAITDEAQLRAIIGSPAEVVVAKIADRLNDLTRQFIDRSPFVCVATNRPDGGVDVSPRGDPAGFVRILDDRTLLVPERPGNRIADTLTNLLADPRIGLLFLIPGVGDSFRVNGRATIVDDPDLLAASEVENAVPRIGMLVTIEEAFTQCSKALIRSDLWNPELHVSRSDLPSQGEILRSLIDSSFDADEYERERAKRYARREGLY